MDTGVKVPLTFQIYKGNQLVRSETLTQDIIKVGKLASSHLRIDDESVSRMHAVIEITGPNEIHIIDLGSSRGTIVNGQKVNKCRLQSGDEVTIGDTRIKVTVGATAPAAVAAGVTAPVAAPPMMGTPGMGMPAAPPPPPAPMPPAVPVPPPYAPPPFAAAPPPFAAAAVPPPFGAPAVPPPFGAPAAAPRMAAPMGPPPDQEEIEVRDGSRAIEVTAMFDNNVHAVGAFANPKAGIITPMTWGLLAGAGAAFAGAFGLLMFYLIKIGHLKEAGEEWATANGKNLADFEALRDFSSKGADPIWIGLWIAFAILIFWGLLRLAQERRAGHFTIGTANDVGYTVPGELVPAPVFPLVHSTGSDYELLFTHQMTGDITVDGRTVPLQQIQAQAHQSPTVPGAYAWSIPQGARCKIELGQHSFLINSVPPPRSHARPWWQTIAVAYSMSLGIAGLLGALGAKIGLEGAAVAGLACLGVATVPLWRKVLKLATDEAWHVGGTAAVVGLVLLMLSSIPPDAKALSLDLFNSENKYIKSLIKPPEEKDEQIPEWMKKKGQDDGGGKGKRHKGDEGKMGSKKSKQKEGLYGLKGPKDNPDPHMAKMLAEDAAKKAGVLGIFKAAQGSHIASIFGRDSALGNDAVNALGGLIGNQIGEAYGVGGLGLVGTGRGGGGTGEGTIGLGNLGTIGKGGGGGYGSGYGRGMGGIGTRRAGTPDVIPGQAQVRGSLDKEIIRRVIRSHIKEVKFCYEQELLRKPDLYGRVTIQFTITPMGSVSSSAVQSSTMGNAKVEQCIARAVQRWEFPKPQGGGIVIVSYPFVLKASGAQ
ncbi:MAG TPA: TonB family protein [Polyangia bacterium]|jgi:TonB family protein